jgi:type II secretory pathway pseudopilin PulG
MATGDDPIEHSTPLTASAARPLHSNESGWTLIELLVVAALLVVVLTAILSIADGTQRTAAADQERANTVGAAQAGLSRIANDLRNACVFFGANGTGTTGTYCRQTFTQAPGTSACTRSSDCVDFIVDARTTVSRPTGAANRSFMRVRINCGTADPASAARTQCSRFAVACTPASCPSPTALSGVLVRSLTNGGATGSPANVFVYCTRHGLDLATGTAVCSATPATADAVQISLAIARKGQRRTGGAGSFLLQDGAELNNINEDTS